MKHVRALFQPDFHATSTTALHEIVHFSDGNNPAANTIGLVQSFEFSVGVGYRGFDIARSKRAALFDASTATVSVRV